MTRLLSGKVVLDKVKGKGKAHPLVHAPNTCMSITQCKVSIGLTALLFGLTNPCTQHSFQVMVSNSDNNIEMVDGLPIQEESSPSTHAIKSRLCKKNNQLCISIPGQTCNQWIKAKTQCNKLMGQIGSRKEIKVADTKGKAPDK